MPAWERLLRSAVLGAQLNVRINAAGLKDRAKAEELLTKASSIAADAIRRESEILRIVNDVIDKS